MDWSGLRGRLIVVSGASGSGKSTLLRHVLARPEVRAGLSISATTRSPRPGEEHGREYFFLTRSQFADLIAREELLEWAEVHGNLYGTPALPVRDRLIEGWCVVLEIDVQGALQVRSRVAGTCLIFIHPPSLEILEERLRRRSTEDEASIANRMKNARWEMEQSHLYDHQLLNEDLDEAVERLAEIFIQSGCGGRDEHA
ncbi:MAG: guanylate kinase [Isosphaeraceae bacterium]|nr:guanylate kinase [Isosphaeraceae bacterium]